MKTSWLKDHIGFLSIFFVGFCSFVLLAVIVSQQGIIFLHGPEEEFGPVFNSFRQAHKPVIEINFTALYGGVGQFQILHPLLSTRGLEIKESNLACNDRGNFFPVGLPRASQLPIVDKGFLAVRDERSEREQTKKDIWERFLNNRIKPPASFLTTSPYIDDWGSTYAYLLAQSGQPPFNSKNWVEEHLSFFKVSELAELLQKHQISDSRFSVISRFSDSEIEKVIRAAPLILTKDYLLVLDQSRFGFSPLSYLVYDVRDFQATLKSGKYELTGLTSDSLCLQKVGNACWTYSSKHSMAYLYRYSQMIILLIGFIIIISSAFYLKQLYQKNREQNKNRLALQVLSHEFRTPVSSMLLMMDQLSRRSSEFEVADQDLLTRVSTEVFRLQRIIEISRTYLQTESHRVHFKTIEIPSLNTWVSEFVLEIDKKVEVQPLQRDRGIVADPFWLKFILSSLVQNAFAHGRPPVILRLGCKSKKISITVEDHGDCDFETLHEMTDAFVKSNRSKGMGLGLNIIKFILDDWGAELGFSKAPTSFTLLLREQG